LFRFVILKVALAERGVARLTAAQASRETKFVVADEAAVLVNWISFVVAYRWCILFTWLVVADDGLGGQRIAVNLGWCYRVAGRWRGELVWSVLG
jgi:hypothetical protein